VRGPRRRFLRGSGCVVLAIPVFEALAGLGTSRRRAAAAEPTRRLVMYFVPEGQLDETKMPVSAWFPKAGANPRDFALAPIMQPLLPYKNEILVFKGIDHQSAHVAGSNHESSMVHALTAGGGESVDQSIAARVGGGHRFRSLELGIKTGSGTDGRLSYSSGKSIPSENSPERAFGRLFTSAAADRQVGASGNQALEAIFARRRSVIDAVKVEIEAATREVGAADRPRLDAYLTSLREVEKSLQASQRPAPISCKSPNLEATATDDFAVIGKQHMDILALALACDLTPVASVQWSRSGSGEKYTFLGNTTDTIHHGFSHGQTSPQKREFLQKIYTWYMTQYAYFIAKLKSIDEGGKSVFDSTAVVWFSHFGNGQGHTALNVPYVIAGSAGGRIKVGQFLDFKNVPQSRLFASLGAAMSANVSGGGGLPGVT
jgi:hypothetical protein